MIETVGEKDTFPSPSSSGLIEKYAPKFFLHRINIFSLCGLINVVWKLFMSFHQRVETAHVRNLYYRQAGCSPCPLTRIVWSNECELFHFYHRKIIACDSLPSSSSFKPSVSVSLHKPQQPTEPTSLILIYTKGSVRKHLQVPYKLHFEALYIAKLIRQL